MSGFVSVSGSILHALQEQVHLSKDKGWGLLIGALAVISTLLLNAYPLIKAVSILQVQCQIQFVSANLWVAHSDSPSICS
jgi:hypothetical protein